MRAEAARVQPVQGRGLEKSLIYAVIIPALWCGALNYMLLLFLYSAVQLQTKVREVYLQF